MKVTKEKEMDVFVPTGGRMWTTEQSMLSRQATGVTSKLCLRVLFFNHI